MLLQKITQGYVVQVFSTDQQDWVSQNFFAGDIVEYETIDGDSINYEDFLDRVIGKEPYLPFNMKQPGN